MGETRPGKGDQRHNLSSSKRFLSSPGLSLTQPPVPLHTSAPMGFPSCSLCLCHLDQSGPCPEGLLCQTSVGQAQGSQWQQILPWRCCIRARLNMNTVTQTISPPRKNLRWGEGWRCLERMEQEGTLRAGNAEEKPTTRGGPHLPLLCKQSRGRTDRRHQGFRRARLRPPWFVLAWLLGE